MGRRLDQPKDYQHFEKDIEFKGIAKSDAFLYL